MKEAEKAVRRSIAETEKQILIQQGKIARLKAENKPIELAEEMLAALRDLLRVRRARLDALREFVKAQNSSD